MIGQERLKSTIAHMIAKSRLPRFIILEGDKGSGRKTFAVEGITKELEATFVEYETGVDSVREMIEQSYRLSIPTVYFIGNADKMSLAAKNAMLKIVEEPPNNAYFVVSMQDRENTLETIRSRAMVLSMDAYSRRELEDYWMAEYPQFTDEFAEIADYARNIGDLQFFANEFITSSHRVLDFAKTVLENVATVSGVNALKIAGYFNLGDEPNKVDVEFFMYVFRVMCFKRMIAHPCTQESEVMAQWVRITASTSRMLRTQGMTVLPILDMWLFDLRKAANDCADR